MSECLRIKPMLSLSAGSDLGPQELMAVRAHLAVCPTCSAEEAEFSGLISSARAALSSDYRLPDNMRGRIARDAALAAGRGSWLDRLVAPLAPMQRWPGLLAAAAAMLVAVVALPVLMRHQAGTPAGDAGITTLEVVAADGSVRLAWRDGEKGSYTVFKSSDPRQISRGEAHVVRGNIWTDTNPDSSPVVFYRIE
ncbi:MAG TPA: zf-HC2 domain-containing protein [Candidatus Polarisedimenticolia bacterium]|nr:zf-HC2 domain-containing protein [Candidatus Polarisedimenticolia bacterium]